MAADDLSAPLGQDKRPRERRNGLPFLQLVAAALGALTITIIGWAMLVEDPLGGEPMAVAPIDLATVSKGKSETPAAAAPSQGIGQSHEGSDRDDSPAVAPPPSRTVTIIDGTSGQRREIVIPGLPDSRANEQPARPARGTGAKSAPDARSSARTISVR